ncbi:MAG: rhomboid family intramembrane serine protease [Elusimicrobia bacterium]|nr:rhomboid family intramembrane serine protease [Elusimicrobiota bacterium]MDE2511553.1 rhomboid family intramembrane serine protease [Elusimicrobiota bacterium]
MDGAWVDKLEKRWGFLAAPDLPIFIAVMTVVCALLGTFKPEFVDALGLDPAALLHGQVWRLFTFLFIPPPAGPLWLILWIAMLYAILQALETAWGEFKITVFLLIGMLATALGALAVGVEYGNSVVMLAAFLAFARLLPDREILVMFILPVKLRWLAALTAVWIAVEFATGSFAGRVQLLTGLAPYLLFFGEGHARDLRYAWRRHRGGPP